MSVQAAINERSASRLREASQTASVSYDPKKHSKIGHDNAGKIVAFDSGNAVSSAVVVQDVQKVWETMNLLLARQKVVRDTLQWTMSSHMRGEVEDLGVEFGNLAKEIHGIQGVSKKIAFIEERRNIPDVIRRVQELEMVLLIAQKNLDKLDALTQTKQIHALYVEFKESLRFLFSVIEEKSDENVDHFKKEVDGFIKSYVGTVSESLNEHLRDLSVRNIESFKSDLQAIKSCHIKDKAERRKHKARNDLYLMIFQVCKWIGVEHCNSARLPVLQILIDHIKKDAKTARKEVLVAGSRSVLIDVHAEASVEELNELKTDVDPDYKKYDSWWTKRLYSTGNLVVAMEQEVGLCFGGLILKLKRRIMDFCQGNGKPIDGQNTAKDEFDHYQSCIRTLEGKIDEHLQTVCNTRYDGALTLHIFDYAQGLKMAASEAKSLLALARRCHTDPSVKIFEALKSLEIHYKGFEGFDILSRSSRLYDPLLTQMAAEAVKPQIGQKPFDKQLSRTLAFLHEVHGQKDPEILTLTPIEKKIVHVVMQTRANGELPEAVCSYLAKRILRFLFFPAPAHDMELELVLHVLRRDFEEQYQQFVSTANLGEVIGAYENAYHKKRILSEKFLKLAALIAKEIFKGYSGNYFSYVSALQKLIEFGGHDEGSKAMSKVLNKWLTAACEENGYFKIDPQVTQRHIDTWTVDSSKNFIDQLQAAEVDNPEKSIQHLFSSIMLRLAAVGLYSKDLFEQASAQEKLVCLLKAEELAIYFNALPYHVRCVLIENILEKVRICSFVEGRGLKLLPKEEELLMSLASPMHRVMHSQFLKFEDRSVLAIMYKLVKGNSLSAKTDALIRDAICRKCRPEWAPQDWMKPFDAFCEGDAAIQLIDEKIL